MARRGEFKTDKTSAKNQYHREYYRKNAEYMREYNKALRCGIKIRKKKPEYAVYKADKFLFIGTVDELSEYFNVKKSTVRYWACKTNLKRAEKAKFGVKFAIKVEE